MTEPGSRSNDGNCLVEGTERHNEEGFLIDSLHIYDEFAER